jgi:alpha-amylase
MKKFLNTRFLVKLIWKILLGFVIIVPVESQSRQVILQGFWWDWKNSTYSNKFANYIAEFSPRLRRLGIDAVWVMPSIKNSGELWMGYGPFDGYDLGDKYQKGHVNTIFGNKNDLLRMVGVLHANNIDVVQDIVYNHFMCAGSLDCNDGSPGAIDPVAWTGEQGDNQRKNFRYVSFLSPAKDESADNYLSRSGRFSKNWQNFHRNPAHNCWQGDICANMFDTDVCYWEGAFGQSSNATFNPRQYSQYMRTEQRNWSIWYKKQVGFDGVRLDAVKHFEPWAAEDFLYNMQWNAGWANGTNDMFAVGEWVGSIQELDQWCNDVNNRAGTFDFGLRNALFEIKKKNGDYDLGEIPGKQQQNRWRTIPFVEIHDMSRPKLDSIGNYTGEWNRGQELWDGHIEPWDCRLPLLYAIICAMDGSPLIYIEDLFDFNNGKRYTHKPTDTIELPVRSDIENIIQCRQSLRFMDGPYLVRYKSPDHLIIERGGKAVISVNDTWNQWKEDWIDTNFPAGTILKDYSGVSDYNVTVQNDHRVQIKTPPCDGLAINGRRGYAIWAPVGQILNYIPDRLITTTQEWEMANDLGDSNAKSLQEGGALPAKSNEWRKIGKSL